MESTVKRLLLFLNFAKEVIIAMKKLTSNKKDVHTTPIVQEDPVKRLTAMTDSFAPLILRPQLSVKQDTMSKTIQSSILTILALSAQLVLTLLWPLQTASIVRLDTSATEKQIPNSLVTITTTTERPVLQATIVLLALLAL